MTIKFWDADTLSLFGNTEYTRVMAQCVTEIQDGTFVDNNDLKDAFAETMTTEEFVRKALIVAKEEAIFKGVAKMIQMNNEKLLKELEIHGVIRSDLINPTTEPDSTK